MASIMDILKIKPFVEVSVGQLLWGYEDPLLKLAKDVVPKEQKLPYEEFGVLYGKNSTSPVRNSLFILFYCFFFETSINTCLFVFHTFIQIVWFTYCKMNSKDASFHFWFLLIYFCLLFDEHRIVSPFSLEWMISHSSVSLINTTVSNICHIGDHPPVTIWTALMDPFSHRTSPKIPRCICTTKICAACCHCRLKRKWKHETMCPATDSLHRRKYSHRLKIIQTICASVHTVHHALHTACSTFPLVNTVIAHYSLSSWPFMTWSKIKTNIWINYPASLSFG